MKIQSIEVYHVAMPLTHPFRTAASEWDSVESVLVRIVSGENHGWGECTPKQAPNYSSEWAQGAFIVICNWLAPLLMGQDITSGEQLQGTLSGVKGNYFAKAGLDLAWWDLYARSQGKPLWKLIGGKADVVDVGADFGVTESVDELLTEVAGAEEAGFKRVKLKCRPGWDVDIISAVRRAFPDVVMHVDFNSAYTLDNLPMFRELDRYDLTMIEQPLAHDDLLDHATLQQEIRTPVCLDESIVSVDKARKAIQLGACQWINIKLGRVGGLTNAVAIHDLCQEAGMPCWVGGSIESAVGQAHNIALATLPNIRYPADIFPSSRFYQQDLAEPEIVLIGPPQVRATAEPGIGCEPHPERLQQLLLKRTVVQRVN